MCAISACVVVGISDNFLFHALDSISFSMFCLRGAKAKDKTPRFGTLRKWRHPQCESGEWSSKTDSKNPISAVNNVMSPGMHARTHACTHARTHAHTHTHKIIYIHIYINIMYRPTFKKKRHHVICQDRITFGPSFYFEDPVFSEQWGPRMLFFMPQR